MEEATREEVGSLESSIMKKKKTNGIGSDDKDDNHEDNNDDNSSCSSIPLKDLKRHMAAAQAKKKKAAWKVDVDKDDHDDNDDDDDNNSNSSSMPLKDLKRHMAAKAAQRKSKATPSSKKSEEETKAKATQASSTDGEEEEDEEEEDELDAACCLCHCGMDGSDRALFFPRDRRKELADDEKYDFGMDDPYLPVHLYDPHNALVYCDGCSRLYHQKCHFVPLLVIPRGNWHCLLCHVKVKVKTSSTSGAAAKAKAKPSNKNTPPITIYRIPPKFTNKATTQYMFQSPPTANMKRLEQEFLLATSTIQAQLWQTQLRQATQWCKTQASNIRTATAALVTLTMSRRNRQFLSPSSQLLADTLHRLTQSKWKLRTALLSWEGLRKNANQFPTRLLLDSMTTTTTKQKPKDTDTTTTANYFDQETTMSQYLFPHGVTYYLDHSWTVPRTAEYKGVNEQDFGRLVGGVMDTTTTTTTTMTTMTTTTPIPNEISIAPSNATTTQTSTVKNDVDDDRSFELEDLQCCVCHVGDATDENDVLLCDGEGCCRAFHMNCVWPPIILQSDLDEDDDDWFCPLCQRLSNILGETQEACHEEDWIHRKEAAASATTKRRKKGQESREETNDDDDNDDTDDADSSLESWNVAADVYPHAEWEYAASRQLKAGKQTAETVKLLAVYLGVDFLQAAGMMTTEPMPVGSDSEDENDYSLFDEASFEERKRKQKKRPKAASLDDDDVDGEANTDNDDDDDDDANASEGIAEEDTSTSTRSSQATLQEMSSVELNIDKNELAALSDGLAESDEEEDSSNDGTNNDDGPLRVSRRLRGRATAGSSGHTSLADNIADFDEANILPGKRRRKAVDYRKLNDVLFGDLSAKERAKLDDKVDYRESSPGRKRTKQSN